MTGDLRGPAAGGEGGGGRCAGLEHALSSRCDSRFGNSTSMKRKAAKSERKPSRRPQPKSSRPPTGKHAGAEAAKASRLPSRAVVMRLAAEVDALAAQLQDSRARILDLEARVDVDPLTDVLNRRGFERELRRSLAYVKRYGASAALIYIDLDGFKPVNDRHGHGAGDTVLKAIAAALVRNVRASDVVARLGGDEFAVLLWNVNGANAAAKAGALEAAVYGTPVRWSSSTLVVGASAGVVLLGALDTPADVIARADAAMYARKAERKGTSSVSPHAGRG
jgi:diguanylate cyclase (GGDEF)-like protein